MQPRRYNGPSRSEPRYARSWLYACVWIAALLCTSATRAQIAAPTLIPAHAVETNLAMSLHYLIDEDKTLTYDEVRNLPPSRWQAFSGSDFRMGNSRAAFWIAFSFKGDAALAQESEFMLEFNVAFLGEIDVHLRRGSEVTTVMTGLKRPFSQRPYPAENPVIPLRLDPGEQVDVWMRVTNEGPILLPIALFTKQQYHLNRAHRNLLYGAFFSLCIVLGSYNLFLYFSIRDSSYLLYTLAIFLLGWLQASVLGFTVHHVWRDRFTAFSYIEPAFLLWTWYTIQMFFTRKFLQFDTHFKHLDWVFLGVAAFCALMAVASWFPPLYWLWELYGIAAPTLIIGAIAAAVYAYRQGLRAARFYLIGSSLFLLGGVLTTFYYTGIAPAHVLTQYGVLIGSATEGILFSLALADRINGIQRENLLAQQEARRALEVSNQDKNEFLIAVSHELRTPLNAIMGAVELSKKESALDRLKEYNEITLLGLQRMQDSVDNLLFLSTLNAHQLVPQHVPFLFRDVLADLAITIKQACHDKQLRFEWVNNLADRRRYLGDPGIVRMLLKQLLNNAVTFTREGHVKLTLNEYPGAHGEPLIEAVIEDTGEGIAPDRINTLFDAFRQGSSGYNRTHEGLGLGLNICQRLVQLLGGRIDLQSTLAKGTCVSLQIPLALAQVDAHNNLQTSTETTG